MIPIQEFGATVDSVILTDAKDFSNLMPRPGWKECLGLFVVHL